MKNVLQRIYGDHEILGATQVLLEGSKKYCDLIANTKEDALSFAERDDVRVISLCIIDEHGILHRYVDVSGKELKEIAKAQ